jgi:peptidoglycan/xylan/chitin deacetylase (PgdA/CDA1 family)
MGVLRALTELRASFRGAVVRVPCYHRTRSRERFFGQMMAPAEQGYAVLSMEEFTGWLHGRKQNPGPSVLLTFDGCDADQLEHAVPVLRALNYPATFFPVSYHLESELTTVALTWRRTLQELAALGFTIGCHSHTHRDLTALTGAELWGEVADSKKMLEDILGHQVDAFCYPYGACNSHVASVVQEAGVQVAFTVDLGGANSGDDRYRLKRIPILGEPKAREFSAYVSGHRLLSGAILTQWKIQERLLD